MAVKLVVPIVSGATVEIEADSLKQAITDSMFWTSLPKVCPICRAALVMFFQDRAGYKYYGLECAGRPKHKTDFGQFLEGGGMWYRGLFMPGEKPGERVPAWNYYDHDLKESVPVLPPNMENKQQNKQQDRKPAPKNEQPDFDPHARPQATSTRPRDMPPIQEDEFPPELPDTFFLTEGEPEPAKPNQFIVATLNVLAKMGVNKERALAGAKHVYKVDSLEELDTDQLKKLTEVFRRDIEKRKAQG